jgi:hypothetical protein
MLYEITSAMAQEKIKNYQSNSALRIKMRVKNDQAKKKKAKL